MADLEKGAPGTIILDTMTKQRGATVGEEGDRGKVRSKRGEGAERSRFFLVPTHR